MLALSSTRHSNSAPKALAQGLRRRAAAAAEFAIVAPVFVVLIIGALELSRGIWAKETLTDAARRACRTGTQPRTNTASIQADVISILNDHHLDSASATITVLVNDQNVDASTAKQDDKISVKVSMPVSKTMIVTALFLKSSSIESATVVMMRYGD